MNRKRRFVSMLVVLALAIVAFGPAGTAATIPMSIALRSGQANLGEPDSGTEFSRDLGATWAPAIVMSPHPAYSILPGTKWISVNSSGDGTPSQTVWYRAPFELPAGFVAPSLAVSVHADNAAKVYLNGTLIGQQTDAEIFENFQDPAEAFSTSNASLFVEGTNTLLFHLRNYGDPSGLDYSADVAFEVPSNEAPDCSTVRTVTELWPPNHEMRSVTLSGATDPDGDAVVIDVTGVTQDEPVPGPGLTHAPDASDTADPATVALRAERLGGGDGRVYRIAFSGDDGHGGTCTGSVVVAVPHDRSGAAAVDSGVSFDSYG